MLILLVIVLPCTITDLIGQALSELTCVDIPFKTQSSKVGYDDHGLRILSWTVSSLLFLLYSNNSFSSLNLFNLSLSHCHQCLPVTLHFPYTGCLHFQIKVYLIKGGELGKPSSTYGAKSLVTQVETGKVVYTANGTFSLNTDVPCT